MDPALAVSALIARHHADLAMAVAARMRDMNPSAADRLLETVSDNAEDLERISADIASGVGEMLDISV